MPRMFSADDLDTMQIVRCAFDPRGLSWRAKRKAAAPAASAVAPVQPEGSR